LDHGAVGGVRRHRDLADVHAAPERSEHRSLGRGDGCLRRTGDLLRVHPATWPARADLPVRRGRGGAAHLLGVGASRLPAEAVARAARSLMTVAIGLVPVLLISGFVEAFVTPSGLPAAVRIAIGAGVWIAFLVYMLGRGRQVHRRGITGDLSEEMVGDQVATA